MLVSFSPVTGHTLPDRYIEGTCPICGYPGGAWRPVRQLRQPARPDRPDQPAVADRRLDARVPRDQAPLPRPAAVRGAAADVDRVARRLAPERPELLARAARRAPAAADHARPRLGRPHPGARLRRGREQADLRLVRRGDRLPLGLDRVGRGDAATPTPGASGGRTPRRSTTTSRARTTSSSTR